MLRYYSYYNHVRTFYTTYQQLTFCHRDSVAILNEDGRHENPSLVYVPNNTWDVVGTLEETKDTCDGKSFLKCLLEDREKSSDIDDLADFIECKQGKDYSGWLKNRLRYRKWKYEKHRALMLKKKKKLWRLVKGRSRKI